MPTSVYQVSDKIDRISTEKALPLDAAALHILCQASGKKSVVIQLLQGPTAAADPESTGGPRITCLPGLRRRPQSGLSRCFFVHWHRTPARPREVSGPGLAILTIKKLQARASASEQVPLRRENPGLLYAYGT